MKFCYLWNRLIFLAMSSAAAAKLPITNANPSADQFRRTAATTNKYKAPGTTYVAGPPSNPAAPPPAGDAGRRARGRDEVAQFQVPVGPLDADDDRMQFLHAIQDPDQLERYIPGEQHGAAELKQAISTVGTQGNGAVQLMADADRVAAYAQRKAQVIEHNQYRDWVQEKFDLSDPYQLQLYNRLQPDVLQQREKMLDHWASNSATMRKIQLRGVQSENDLRFLWMLENGYIQVMEQANAGWLDRLGLPPDPRNGFVPGMFNPYPENDTRGRLDMTKQGPFSQSGSHSAINTREAGRYPWFATGGREEAEPYAPGGGGNPYYGGARGDYR